MVEAALTSEAVAVAVAPASGTTIIIITRAHVGQCAALSQIAGHMFVATIGAGSLAETVADSPLGDARWSRARTYLTNDPIAIAIDRDAQRIVAVAQPKPLAAWVTIDAVDIAPLTRGIESWLARQKQTGLRALGTNLDVQARGSQLLVRAKKLEVDELALVITDVLRAVSAPEVRVAPTFACPPLGGGIVQCNGTEVRVASLATTLRKLVEVRSEPAVAAGDVIGIRLSADAEVLLRRGDIILGLDGHRITSSAQLHELAGQLSERTSLAIRRDGTDLILALSE
ncbi:MAG TPA: hypothetical protein VIV11_19575 [Kofleriaceae bacterium]